MKNKTLIKLCAMASVALLAAACGPAEDNNSGNNSAQADNNTGNNSACSGAKCDTPNDDPDYNGLEYCEEREKDMVFSSRKAFTEAGIRWAVADVEGVNAVGGRDDRGQEYTEYFAVVRNIDAEGSELTEETTLLGFGSNGELALDLNEDQEFWLEDNEFEEVGACVFTSWHADVPALECEDGGECPTIIGDRQISLDLMRMKVGFNSNAAAADLVGRCLNIGGGAVSIGAGQSVDNLALENGDPSDPEDVLNRDFMRGCMHIDGIFGTGWRRSDPSVCAGAMRLAECGCTVDGAEATLEGIVSAVLPRVSQQQEAGGITLRGFHIGGWSGVGDEHLPTGCEYIRTDEGDDLNTMVKCTLTAGEVLENSEDLKGYCRGKYANDLTVNVPLPADKITCDPSASSSPYADSCSDMPWIIEYSARN